MDRRQFIKFAGLTTGALAAGATVTTRVGKSTPPAPGPEVKIPTLCEMCTSRCGVYAVVQAGRVVRIEGNKNHPTNLGYPCARGNAGVTSLYDPDRLKRPMKRTADGQFSAISWEQAFKEIGDKLKQIAGQYGPHSVVFAEYNNLNSNLNRRFIEAFGSPNHVGHAATCFANRNVGYNAVMGELPTVDYGNVKYYLSAGRNILGGIKAYEPIKLAEAKRNGAKIVVLDPRLSELAGFGHEWIQIKPASDLAFLLAVAHVLINDGLYDKTFVAKNCIGFEELKAGIAKYTPEWAAAETDVPADTIRRIAYEMAKHAPAAVVDPGWHGGNGMYWNGYEAARAGAVVNALLGNLGAKGGLKFAPKVALGPIDTPPPGVAVGDDGGGG